ncbi:uncharacterized protein EAF02_011783 [Botrytis sinoallii]|uniref:uncharacterized protein n=1 Tax=Botrytis sinoallii TaxID=1463999 RepID=UPI0019015966|nr:uncharacterized protein EAF02_011783 [Botrytis sinoallii]KAF7853793.1 hypothetical protein EAF02_011783 [Botrytis sinoallii]
MSGAWELTRNNPESRVEARESRSSVGMDQPQQGGWRERQEDPPSPSPSGRGYGNYALSTSSFPMARPEQIMPVVVTPVTPTPVVKELHSLLTLRGSQMYPGSSSLRHRSSRSAPYSVRKGAQKAANKRFDRGDPFTSCGNSVNKELNQTSLMETPEEDMQVLEMRLSGLKM